MEGFRSRLRDPRFWVIQAMVLTIATSHALIEVFEAGTHIDAIYFVPASFYFIPVVYASLNFGREGAIPTAIWSAALAIPNILLWHSGLERLGEGFQMGIMILLAILVAGRVDREIAARTEAEAQEKARRLSEARYRGLFDSAGEGVLVVDRFGRVVESNAAAAALLGGSREALRRRLVTEVLPSNSASALWDAVSQPNGNSISILLTSPDGRETWVEPVSTPLVEEEGFVQIVLRDVTQQRRRQLGLETYTAHVLRAQEEERRRIAHEVHDETVQSLVLLCRRLDSIEGKNGFDSDLALRDLRQVRQYAESIVESLRGFIRGLRPPSLKTSG